MTCSARSEPSECKRCEQDRVGGARQRTTFLCWSDRVPKSGRHDGGPLSSLSQLRLPQSSASASVLPPHVRSHLRRLTGTAPPQCLDVAPEKCDI